MTVYVTECDVTDFIFIFYKQSLDHDYDVIGQRFRLGQSLKILLTDTKYNPLFMNFMMSTACEEFKRKHDT